MPSIEIRTEIPGPRSRAWIERKERVVANAKALWVPVFVERAEGALVTDVDGNTFIDFAGGIGRLAVGHSNAAGTAAVQDQVARFLHTDFTVMPYDSYVELAERLCARLPITGETKAAFFNSGAEAVENAVKIARAATGRQAVIAYEGAFHGRTHMAMSLTSSSIRTRRASGRSRPRCIASLYPVRVPLAGRRRCLRGRTRRPAARVHDADRAGVGGGDRDRAHAGRGRLRPGAPPRT